MSDAATLTTEAIAAPTALTTELRAESPDLTLRMHAGAVTPQSFSSTKAEVAAAVTGAACYDLGYRTRIRITGEDRLRWLNGMVSNAIQTLHQGYGNYNFILNAQGRIQGDAYIYRRVDDLLLDTDRSQVGRLFAHLDHFIIMDDVELHPLDDATTGIGLCGPQAGLILDGLGIKCSTLAPLQFEETTLAAVPITMVRAYSVLFPRCELWFAPEYASTIWRGLTAAGATPIGIDAVEAIRVLEGTPRYGIDITDRHLPQETAQNRALNFSKGCYLGQEIVERIRSRATVHRTLRQFMLDGAIPQAPIDLHAGGDAATPSTVGQLTSVTEIRLPEFHRTVAIGSIRVDAIDRKSIVAYEGGTVTVLDHPPVPRLP
jgi:folate-binding protein YgfZ